LFGVATRCQVKSKFALVHARLIRPPQERHQRIPICVSVLSPPHVVDVRADRSKNLDQKVCAFWDVLRTEKRPRCLAPVASAGGKVRDQLGA